jgi:TRAP-type C4-dicarboxylate transport system substrate-binding protein
MQRGTIDAFQSDDATMASPVDMKGKRVFGVPTAGKFLSQYGLIPVTVPWDDVEVALQTGELDGVAWCGFTEAYEVGWADVCNYALTNSITGAWCGFYFANTESWNKVPPHLQALFRSTIDQSHYYRNVWYWAGEAKLRVEGGKLELTSLPKEEWDKVTGDAEVFWDKIADRRLRKSQPSVVGKSDALRCCCIRLSSR